jgi:hypothetical protein
MALLLGALLARILLLKLSGSASLSTLRIPPKIKSDKVTDQEFITSCEKILSDYPAECPERKKIEAQIERLKTKLAK